MILFQTISLCYFWIERSYSIYENKYSRPVSIIHDLTFQFYDQTNFANWTLNTH